MGKELDPTTVPAGRGMWVSFLPRKLILSQQISTPYCLGVTPLLVRFTFGVLLGF